jgi:hypothetical protein
MTSNEQLDKTLDRIHLLNPIRPVGTGLRFSIRDIVIGTTVFAVNIALWLAAV